MNKQQLIDMIKFDVGDRVMYTWDGKKWDLGKVFDLKLHDNEIFYMIEDVWFGGFIHSLSFTSERVREIEWKDTQK